jgi:hypothetical protein
MELASCNRREFRFGKVLSFCRAKLPFFEKRIGARKELWGSGTFEFE